MKFPIFETFFETINPNFCINILDDFQYPKDDFQYPKDDFQYPKDDFQYLEDDEEIICRCNICETTDIFLSIIAFCIGFNYNERGLLKFKIF